MLLVLLFFVHRAECGFAPVSVNQAVQPVKVPLVLSTLILPVLCHAYYGTPIRLVGYQESAITVP